MNRFSRILYPFVIARNIFLREIGANQDRNGAERQAGCRFRAEKYLKISAAGLFISLADMLPDVSGSAECIKVFHDEQSIKNDGAGYERQLFGEFQKLRDKKNGRDFVWQKEKVPA